jgi:uncharacterized protein (TIGR03437 family)
MISLMRHRVFDSHIWLLPVLFGGAFASAQAALPNRVTAAVDNNQRVYLNGHVHAGVQSQNDQGLVDSSLQLTHMTLHFRLSAAQQADLDQLLTAQQNPSSPSYRQWLTPDQYGARFGVSDADLAAVTTWLQGEGLTVTGTARARNFVTFDGAATNVQRAFRIELHSYLVNGETHFANAADPSVPAALSPVVRNIHGLTDFRLKPRMKFKGLVADYTSSRTGNVIAPDDFATIYDIMPLYASGINGTGQKVVVVGQTEINLSDLESFRTMFNLPGQDPTLVLVPNSRSVGISQSDLGEADLDLEWTSAVARNASILFVYANDVSESWTYAVDQSLAPVMNSSYGSCEQSNGSAEAAAMEALAQQANVEGITWFAASGDSGAADCDGTPTTANGLSVDMPASIPEVTGVGGTEFNEGSGTYWNTTNNANGQSVISYIPETSWNDSATDGSPSASGGGASIYFPKPTWQTGIGVPSDGYRDVPDLALAASADHDGYYTISNGRLGIVGGTSASAQVMGGIGSLLNQYLGQNGLSNINPKLYSLAQISSSAFHDITSGNNIVTVPCGRLCTATPVGYNAGVGYDQVTGLGSVDVYNLFNAWNGAAAGRLVPQIAVSATSSFLTSGGSTVLTANVTSSSGTTPTGTVTFLIGSNTLGSATLSGSGGTATASLTVSASQLSAGVNNIAAEYSSDNSTFTNAAASITITVSSSSSAPSISGIADGASFGHSYAPGEVLSIFGSGLATATQAASSLPLPTTLGGTTVTINGVAAPMYAATPNQLNVQIPYEIQPGSNATLQVQSNAQSASYSFTAGATAPAIFTNSGGAPVPNTSGNLGSTLTLYITGGGAVSPTLADGAAPASGTAAANLPKPVNQPVSVTIGGHSATVSFIGIPVGLVGVMQVNYTLPTTVTAGVQPVIVTIGSASSSPAHLTVLR